MLPKMVKCKKCGNIYDKNSGMNLILCPYCMKKMLEKNDKKSRKRKV